jgi:hypothetical protein
MQDLPKRKEPVHYSLALGVLKGINAYEADLLARELNTYHEAIRACAGRTDITAGEMLTLFARMHDVSVIRPNEPTYRPIVPSDPPAVPSKPPPVDLDSVTEEIHQTLKNKDRRIIP